MQEHAHIFGPFLTNQFDERYLPSVNRETFSQVGSLAFYQRHFGESFDKEDTLFLIVGTDGGLLINHLINSKLKSGVRCIFIEFPEIIQRMQQEQILPAKLPDWMAVESLENWFEKAEEFSLTDYIYLSNVRAVKSLAVVDASYAPYLDLWNGFQERLLQFQRKVGHELGSLIFTQKGLANLGENRIPSTCLSDSFKGQTAVLLAGGPSVSDALPWVKENRDKLVVIAVSRLSKLLLDEGVDPDILVSIDPFDVSFFVSRDMLHHYKNSLFVNMYHASSLLTGQWRGRSVYMGPVIPWKSELSPPNYMFAGTTVSHQAFGLAAKMGFSRILLAGFDLCFSREGFTHFKGSMEHSMGPDMEPSNLLVETNGGWQAETWLVLHQSIESLGQLAMSAQEQGIEVINPAPGAAKIPHVNHAPWSEIVLEALPEKPSKVIAEYLPKETAESRIKHYKSMADEVMRIRKQVVRIRDLTKEALVCNTRLFGKNGKPGDFKFKLRMDEIEKSLDDDFEGLSILVRRWCIRDFLKLTRPDKEREWSDEEIQETGQRYYEVYRDSASDVIKFLDDTRQRLLSRQEEEKPKPNYRQLMTQWSKDDTPGRLQIVLDHRGQTLADLPEPLIARLKPMQEQFETLMSREDNPYRDELENQHNPLTVRAKALRFFRNREVERMGYFITGLEGSDLEYLDQCLHLVKGYHAELRGDFAEAETHYQAVDVAFFQVDSLPRLSAVQLREKRLEPALKTLAAMAELMPVHMPNYAGLLRLTGQKEKAVGVFEAYLKHVSMDHIVRLKLGHLLAEMGRSEEARTQFQLILDKDPENQPALRALMG
ncbi:MAG: DUF115 domain-containing protein [Magnetococcales bacterium]|nr:DUF115 domain-containing protein [Magnetococcales bacterium]